ncbi:DUF7660 family protein [Singulisphaera rosea]
MTMATLNSNLNDQVEAIRTRDDFAEFARHLLDDLRTYPADWENRTLEAYLEALAAWNEDCDGYYRNRGEATPLQPSWKSLGELLLAAKMYE